MRDCFRFGAVLLFLTAPACGREDAAERARERHFGIVCGPGTSLRGRESEFDLHEPVGCVRPDGTRHGPFIEDEELRTPTGSLRYTMSQGEYRDGLRVGTWIVRNQFDGTLLRVETYWHGELWRSEAVSAMRVESCEGDGKVSVSELHDGRATRSSDYAASGGRYERLNGDGPPRIPSVTVRCSKAAR